ncbi:hypothetical protein ACE6H2_023394 [Prunus campanulata]
MCTLANSFESHPPFGNLPFSLELYYFATTSKDDCNDCGKLIAIIEVKYFFKKLIARGSSELSTSQALLKILDMFDKGLVFRTVPLSPFFCWACLLFWDELVLFC